MKPAPFDYVAPSTLSDVLALLADDSRDVKLIAGGQSLIPMLNMRLARPEVLVDLTGVTELDGVHEDESGRLHVGAAVRQTALAQAPLIRGGWPLLCDAIGQIGHPQIRHRGTVCGSLAHHDPAAELPAVAVALDATFTVAGPGGLRSVAADDFFVSTFLTAVEPEEVLTEVVFAPARGDGWAFAELARRHGDFAAVGVAVRLRRRNEVVESARIVFCGADVKPLRVVEAEHELIGNRVDTDSVAAACRRAVAGMNPPADIHASSEYRREAGGALLDQAIADAWERCDA